MTRYYRTKTISTALVISGLLVLLPGCEKKGSAEKIGEKIDNVVEDIGEKFEEAGDSLTNDGPAENIGEELDEAAKNAGEKLEKVSDKIRNVVNSDE
jgi:hypothetical protein